MTTDHDRARNAFPGAFNSDGTPTQADRLAEQIKRAYGRNNALKLYESVDALAALASQVIDKVDAAARDVLAERQRQISVEGWTPEHDDEHDEGEMAYAAAGYAAAVSDHLQAVKHEFDGAGEPTLADVVTQPPLNPWPHGWEFKPAPARRLLVKAGALILAEIERIDRASLTGTTS